MVVFASERSVLDGNMGGCGSVSLASVKHLLEPHPAPCLSLFLPTHRNVPHNRVDLPTYRHLVEALGRALSLTHRPAEAERLLAPFHRLAGNVRFWEHTWEGLAVLASAGHAEVLRLPVAVKPLAMVAGRFHTMPLLRIAASTERCQVLSFTSRAARIDQATITDAAVHLDPVPIDDIPGAGSGRETLARGDVVDAEVVEPHRVQRGMGPSGLGHGSVVHGGADWKQDDVDADTEIFLRHVDAVVQDRASGPSGLPLVLVALPRLQAMFRGISKNPLLLADGVPKDPHLMDDDEIGALVAPILAEGRAARISRDLGNFAKARGAHCGSADLADVARAAAAGNVATLLIERDRFEPGWIDRSTGAVCCNGEAPPEASLPTVDQAVRTEDLFGSVAEMVVAQGGSLVALHRNAMPTESGVAAIYRWPV
jgi:hypothetical protein